MADLGSVLSERNENGQRQVRKVRFEPAQGPGVSVSCKASEGPVHGCSSASGGVEMELLEQKVAQLTQDFNERVAYIQEQYHRELFDLKETIKSQSARRSSSPEISESRTAPAAVAVPAPTEESAPVHY